MKYFYLAAFSVILFSATASMVAAANTPSGLYCVNGACDYIPLEPLPVANGAQTGRDFPLFVSGVFKVLITFGGLLAVVMLVVAGIGYMLSESALDIDRAKDRAKAALWGLLILMGSWLILNTINPDLLKFGVLNTALTQLQNRSDSNTASTPPASAALTPAQQQALTSTYNAGSITWDKNSPGQEAPFRERCEAQGGKVGVPISNGDYVTYGCQVPNYMP